VPAGATRITTGGKKICWATIGSYPAYRGQRPERAYLGRPERATGGRRREAIRWRGWALFGGEDTWGVGHEKKTTREYYSAGAKNPAEEKGRTEKKLVSGINARFVTRTKLMYLKMRRGLGNQSACFGCGISVIGKYNVIQKEHELGFLRI